MNDIEKSLKQIMGDFNTKISPIKNSNLSKIFYHKKLFSYPTMRMVVVSPFLFNSYSKNYYLPEDSFFNFFIYDLETDIVIGEISEIDFFGDWEDEVAFHVYDAENKINKYTCPSCGFWLVQRKNIYSHKFIGCSGFPDCDFSCEITDLSN